jgi:hypothetical protein
MTLLVAMVGNMVGEQGLLTAECAIRQCDLKQRMIIDLCM